MIFTQLSQQLQSLHGLLLMISNRQYTHKIAHLGHASIGGHTRHIIELLQCAVNGHQTGSVDYVNRTRDLSLETNKVFAMSLLHQLEIAARLPDKQLAMQVEDTSGSPVITTYFREIIYNTEHAIHHLALIKVALIEMKLYIAGKDFGMAYSTIKYRASLIQAAP